MKFPLSPFVGAVFEVLATQMVSQIFCLSPFVIFSWPLLRDKFTLGWRKQFENRLLFYCYFLFDSKKKKWNNRSAVRDMSIKKKNHNAIYL